MITCCHGVCARADLGGRQKDYEFRGTEERAWRPLKAHVLWADARMDVSILAVQDHKFFENAGFDFYPWRRIFGNAHLRVDSVGFPEAARIERADAASEIVDPREITALIAPVSSKRSRVLRADVERGGIRSNQDWGGFSGAPLFADGVLVGVISKVTSKMTRPELHGQAIETIFANRELSNRLERIGVKIPQPLKTAFDPFSQSVLNEALGQGREIAPFGGRSGRLSELHEWAQRGDTGPIGVIEAQAGLGKSTLLHSGFGRTLSGLCPCPP
jgi:hypothetical protein